ncbi:gamma-glutamylcyclotransferase [Crocosphaera sp. XPORK-15E]|uniref:gamma-glutamylcyclotransferase n=1 Tax=Crocosphaera sp. XPORK-15E TaxID=3110247 RepID=UPI002B1F558D|nr:gamma-glutamylcyclotransferase [Crocosphaera sp. XPORK-15E]MEA5533790.1 gamma-glutamylcyclotransferase [Crocosphaera sp. XPORK-15E]
MSQPPNSPTFIATHSGTKITPSHHQGSHWQPQKTPEPSFYYFAYGSCMCPVDLKRTFGENTYDYVVGTGILQGYRLGFYRHSLRRNCGALDVVPDENSQVEGVLYQLPLRFSDRLDEREEVPHNGYRREMVTIYSQSKIYQDVRTYVVIDKLPQELAPNDWYFNVVLRGAITCGLSEEYCWNLFNHMYQLQLQQNPSISLDKFA